MLMPLEQTCKRHNLFLFLIAQKTEKDRLFQAKTSFEYEDRLCTERHFLK